MQPKTKSKGKRLINVIIILILISAVSLSIYNPFFNKSKTLNDDALKFILNRQYLIINESLTELYYNTNNPEKGIFLKKEGLNEKMASINDDKIYLLRIYLRNNSIDPEAYFFQRQRFYSEIPLNELLLQSQIIHNSTLLENGIIKPADDKIKILPQWPENSVGYVEFNIGDLDILSYKGKLKINLFNVSMPKNSKFEFLYLRNKDSYIEVKGYTKKGFFPFNLLKNDYSNLVKFNSDGSVWIDSKFLEIIDPQLKNVKEGEYELEKFSVKSRNYGLLLWETNLKIKNYQELRKKVDMFYK